MCICDIKKSGIILLLVLATISARAQFVDSMSGLLSAPSAEIYDSGTFFITNNFLNKHYTHTPIKSGMGWNYHTFAYGFGVSFFSRVEVNYVCTIFNGAWNPNPENYRQRIVMNQDRHFAGKLLLLREGEFGIRWLPALSVGISDPVTGSGGGEYIGSDVSGANGYFNRMFIVATRHFNTAFGEVGGSLGYQYNLRNNPHYNAPCAAVTWRPAWLENRWFNPKFILEYDARTPNIGFIADVWDGRFETMFELENFQWISFGLRYKVRLKGAE